jgi:AraC family transcriptional regulator
MEERMNDLHMHELRRRLDRAVALMGARVAEGAPVTLDELADAAALSKYHFHRIYRLLTGEAPGATVRRLRLAQAVGHLHDPDAAVTEAALDAGFGSSQAFAKAVRSALDASPTALRRDPARLGAAFVALSAPQTDAPFRVELAHCPELSLVTLRHVGDPQALHGVYERLFEEAVANPEQVRALIGLQYDDAEHAPTATQRFDAALLLDPEPPELPDDIHRTLVAPRLALRSHHVGGYDEHEPSIDRLVLLALADPSLDLTDAPVLIHYLDDPDSTPPASCRADLYVMVERVA